jgi:hypothetical protein
MGETEAISSLLPPGPDSLESSRKDSGLPGDITVTHGDHLKRPTDTLAFPPHRERVERREEAWLTSRPVRDAPLQERQGREGRGQESARSGRERSRVKGHRVTSGSVRARAEVVWSVSALSGCEATASGRPRQSLYKKAQAVGSFD